MINLRKSAVGRRGCPAACLVIGLLLAGLPTARGQLVLTNFSATHPINVMFIGDSITDDCQTVGAWRSYFQQVMDTNNFPWRAVGRFASPLNSGSYPTPTFNFTKALYEAFCGITIAAPGVTSGQHGYNNQAVFYLDYIIHDALTNAAGSGTNTPDLFCVYIGVNDIGHGRDPFFVATNDMPAFLNLLWSNAPNATVMLVKSSSVEGTEAHSGQYASNSPNTTVYGAALQAMVNQKRAQGKKLFLADAFSVLQPVTTNLYKTDWEHPNAAGLALVAREFATRIEAVTIRTNSLTTTLIYGGEDWKYSDTGADLGATGWTQLNYDDSLWSHGISRLGYGDSNVATTVSYGPDPAHKYITSYFRHQFIVPADTGITNLDFRLTRADGAVVYLNGQEVYRSNLQTNGPVAYGDLALARTVETNLAQAGTNLVSRNPAYRFYATNVMVSGLTPGTNIVAVEVHQSSVTNSVFGFDLELLGSGARFPKPALSASVSGENLLVTWPATNTAPYALYSSTALGAGWSVAPAPLETNAGQVVATLHPGAYTIFLRLQPSPGAVSGGGVP